MQDHCRDKMLKMNRDILFPLLQRAATTIPTGECERNWRRTRRHHAALLGTTVGQGQATILPEGAQCRQRSLQGINWHASTRFGCNSITKDSTLTHTDRYNTEVSSLVRCCQPDDAICFGLQLISLSGNTWLHCYLSGPLSR